MKFISHSYHCFGDKFTTIQRKSILVYFQKLRDGSIQKSLHSYFGAKKEHKQIETPRHDDTAVATVHTLIGYTYEYSVREKNDTIRICKKYFLTALQIRFGRAFRCFKVTMLKVDQHFLPLSLEACINRETKSTLLMLLNT